MKGYYVASFEDAFTRYLPPANALSPAENPISDRHTVTTGHQSGQKPLFQNVTGPSCDGVINGTKPAPSSDV